MTAENHNSNTQSIETRYSFSLGSGYKSELHDPETMTLYGAPLKDILYPGDFFPIGKQETDKLAIIHSSEDWEPATVVLHQKNSPAYLLTAKDVIKSPKLYGLLSESDQQVVSRLAVLRLDYLQLENCEIELKGTAKVKSDEKALLGESFSERLRLVLEEKGICGSSYKIGKQLGIDGRSIERYLKGTFPRNYERIIELSDTLEVSEEWLATGRGSKHNLLALLSELPGNAQSGMIKAIYLLAEPSTSDEILAVFEAHQPLKDRAAFLADIDNVWKASSMAEKDIRQPIAA